MPTGYTAAVLDGTITELAPFAMQLARGMGATIMMRDEPWDAPIPERFEPSDHHERKLAELRAERARLYAMSEQDAQGEADREVAEYEADRVKAEAEHKEKRARYLAMIAKVEAWEGAPEGIKEFGLEQLRSGLDFDCREPFRYWRDAPTSNGVEWRQSRLERLAKDIEYHATEDAKERVRTEGRNEWIAQLRRSLALADTHPQGGDSAQTEAPFMSGAVPSEETADAQTPPTGDDNV